MEFTGDIGVFNSDFHHIKMIDHQAMVDTGVEINGANAGEPAFILSIRFMKSLSINTYYGGRLVAPAYVPRQPTAIYP
jgi:hypothetical protein